MQSRIAFTYFGGIYLACVALILDEHAVWGNEPAGHSAIRLLAPASELGLAAIAVVCVLRIARQRAAAWRITSAVIASLFSLAVGLIYLVQLFSLHISANFLSVLALENAAEGRLVRGPVFFASASLALLWWLAMSWVLVMASRLQPAPCSAWAKPRRNTVILLVVFLLFCAAWLMNAPLAPGRLEASYRETPIASFVSVLTRLHRERRAFTEGQARHTVGGTAFYGPPAFPVEHHEIYGQSLPFAYRSRNSTGAPNVIVIFTEGLSARLIGAYGGKYPGLTPNIDAFAEQAMRVDNYFNHTAATYRGIQGQMDSGYPEAGGAGDQDSWEDRSTEKRLVRTRYQTIPRVLRTAGYQTYFFSPHPDSVALNSLLRSLGFDEVFTLESAVAARPEYGRHLTNGSLSDQDLFDQATRFLDTRQHGLRTTPFFIGIYNIGTHAFFDTAGSGAKYGDGNNQVLNRVHNFDMQFGRFLASFLASPAAKNTVLVLTADHSTFPEPAFRAVVGPDFKPYFVDRIPLVIFDPVHAMPSVFDASGRTSVDFAPSLMQILGIRKADNSFLGKAIFQPRDASFGFVAIGHDYFITKSDGVYSEGEIPPGDHDEFERQKAAVVAYYDLERQNRVFSPRP